MAKSYFLGHGLGVVVAEVAVDAHGEGAAVFVTQPTADGGDVDAGFDADGGEEMS